MEGNGPKEVVTHDHKRTRGDSGSSTQTAESYISDDADDGYVGDHTETRCDEDIYHVDFNENELLPIYKPAYKDRLNTLVYDYPRYREAYDPPKKRHNNWNFITFILGILLIVLIIAFFWGFKEINDIKTELLLLEHTSAKAQPLHQPPEFTAIALRGNGQMQKGRTGTPIFNWQVHFKSGHIGFTSKRKIHIKKPGFYHLYAQMFFYRNVEYFREGKYKQGNYTDDPILDFGITKAQLNERVLAATVSLISCKEACTRHISGIVQLKNGDILTVDTKTPTVNFYMVKEKTLFGTYMVNDDIQGAGIVP